MSHKNSSLPPFKSLELVRIATRSFDAPPISIVEALA